VLTLTRTLPPGERRPVLWSAAYFFCLLASIALVRPVRDALGVSSGVKGLPWLFTGTLLAMLVLGPLMTLLVRRLPPARLLPRVYGFLVVNLIAFAGMLAWLPVGPRVHAARAFFIWASVYNLFAVSLFWGAMADLYRSEQGKRLFGLVAAGGTLGSLIGAAAAAALSRRVGDAGLLGISAVLLAACVVCYRRVRAALPAGAPSPAPPPPRAGAVPRSRYLLAICLYLFLFTMSSTVVYFEQARLVAAHIPAAAGRTAFFARVDFLINSLTVLLQVGLTGRLIAALGLAGTLAVLPLLTLGGFLLVGTLPGLGVLIGFQILRRATDYAVAKPAREVLFTVVAPPDKYAAKSFIDTFVYRGGDALAAWLCTALLGDHPRRLMLVLGAVPLCLCWLAVGVYLGRRQARLLRGLPEPPLPDDG
jgi:AAA family ATP:ADP antiporter